MQEDQHLEGDLGVLRYVLDRVVARLAAIRQTTRTYGTNMELTSTEIHTIQAVADFRDASLTHLANLMGVTKGAMSQTISRLVQKGLAAKEGAPTSGREIRIELTDLGQIAYRNHEAFERRILSAVIAHCGANVEEKVKLYLRVLQEFEAILDLHETMS